jgi:hypothetical protein
MSKALESGTLANKFKEALKTGKNCAIEIRGAARKPRRAAIA